MKTKLLLSIVFLSISLTVVSKTWTITNSGFSFSPATTTIAVGDSVRFNLESIHNAVEVSQATWNSNGSAALPGFSVSFGGGLVLPSQLAAGTHYFVCSPHASLGMKGRIVVQNVTGVKDNKVDSQVIVYPNPTKGKLQININGLQEDKTDDIAIYNLQGAMVYTATGLKPNSLFEIDISGFPVGMYMLRISNESEITNKKILLER